MPAQKDGEGQEEENNEVRPPEQEEEEEVVEEGAQPRRPSLTVLCHAVASALHPTARRLIFRLCDRAGHSLRGSRSSRWSSHSHFRNRGALVKGDRSESAYDSVSSLVCLWTSRCILGGPE